VPTPPHGPLAPLVADPARAALLLDLDGTLAPIVARPEDARMVDGAREVLHDLRGRLGLLGFVSGRGLRDLERIVDLPGVAYAGNHGMELRAPGGAVRIPEVARPYLPAVAGFARGCDPGVLREDGIRLEDKGATLSLHWRTAPDPARAERALRERLALAAEAAGLRVTWGRMVMEVRPPVAIDKGTAVRELVTAAGSRRAAYVGDDRTDADAWVALRAMAAEGRLDVAVAVAAVGAEVPPEVRAAADAEVDGPPGVLALLRGLAAALPGG
jgi:trehalose-phosphatase